MKFNGKHGNRLGIKFHEVVENFFFSITILWLAFVNISSVIMKRYCDVDVIFRENLPVSVKMTTGLGNRLRTYETYFALLILT